MNSELQAYGGQLSPTSSGFGSGALGFPSPRSQIGKALSRVQGQGLVRAASIDVETTLSRVKLSAATSLARTAQSEIAMLTSMEAELIKTVPLAGNRLEFLGNMACVQVSELLADTLNQLRRM
jgi:hypothetical protein